MAMLTPFPSSPQTRALGPKMVAFNKAYLYPTPAYELAKSQIREKVSACVASTMSEYDLALFGSTATGLGLEGSDLDLALVSRDPPDHPMPMDNLAQTDILTRLSSFLRRTLFIRDSTVIRGARVPFIKCLSERHSDVRMKLIISCGDGERTTRYLIEALKEEPLLRPLVVLVRGITTHRLVGTSSERGLGTYATALLVHWYMAAWKAGSGISRPENKHLGEIIIGFLEYFSLRFTYATHCLLFEENGRPLIRNKMDEAVAGFVCVRQGNNRLILLDPSIPESNATRAAHHLPEIRAAFRLALGSIAQHCGIDALKNELATWAKEDSHLIILSPLLFSREGAPPLPGNIFYEMLCEESVPVAPATQQQVIPPRGPTVGAKRVSNGGKGETWNGHVWKVDDGDTTKPILPPSDQTMVQQKGGAQTGTKTRKEKKSIGLQKNKDLRERERLARVALTGIDTYSRSELSAIRVKRRAEERAVRDAKRRKREANILMVDKVDKVDTANPTPPLSNQTTTDKGKGCTQTAKERRDKKIYARLLRVHGLPEWNPDTNKFLPGAIPPP